MLGLSLTSSETRPRKEHIQKGTLWKALWLRFSDSNPTAVVSLGKDRSLLKDKSRYLRDVDHSEASAGILLSMLWDISRHSRFESSSKLAGTVTS